MRQGWTSHPPSPHHETVGMLLCPRDPKRPSRLLGSQAFPAGRKHRRDPPEAEEKVKAAAPRSDTVAKSPGRDPCGGAAPPPGESTAGPAQGSGVPRLRGRKVAARAGEKWPPRDSAAQGGKSRKRCLPLVGGRSPPSLGSEREEGSGTPDCSPAARPASGSPVLVRKALGGMRGAGTGPRAPREE